MTSKKWCIMFLTVLMCVFGVIALLNFIVDPFGVFGDRFFNWFSFDFTKKTRWRQYGFSENSP